MSYTLHLGDARSVLRTLPESSVHCVVTSPPYWRMRDYQTDGQLGLEPTVEEYLANQVEVFRQVRRVLRSDGTLWVNMGDRYSSGGRGGYAGDLAPRAQHYSRKAGIIGTWQSPPPGCKDKELLGLPWRLALALRADGWWLRSDCIWHKPNAKPESVKDRPGNAHEYVFLLAKSENYYYDWWEVREPASDSERNRRARQSESTVRHYKLKRADSSFAPTVKPPAQHGGFVSSIARARIAATGMRNLRSVWPIATQAYKDSHFATFPTALAGRCIVAGSGQACCEWCGTPWSRVFSRCVSTCISDPELKSQGVHHIRTKEYEPPKFLYWQAGCGCELATNADGSPKLDLCTVLDPYNGAGSAGVAAVQHRRKYIGIELNADYIAQARERIETAIATRKERTA